MGRDIFYEVRLLKALSNVILIDSRAGAPTASLGNMFQCCTTLIVKLFFLLSNLHLPIFTLEPLPLVLSGEAMVKSPSPSFL